jgi:hypothetical protein
MPKVPDIARFREAAILGQPAPRDTTIAKNLAKE